MCRFTGHDIQRTGAGTGVQYNNKQMTRFEHQKRPNNNTNIFLYFIKIASKIKVTAHLMGVYICSALHKNRRLYAVLHIFTYMYFE